MADRYWVGGTGTWDTTSTANWSTSSGGAAGAFAPTSSDNVFFDANSNTGTDAFTVTLGTTVSCSNFNTTGIDGAMTLDRVASARLDVLGSFTITSNFSFAPNATGVLFRPTSGSHTITTDGVLISCPISFSGVGATFQLQDALTIESDKSFTIAGGTVDLNGQTVTAGSFIAGGTNVRSLAFASGKIVITGSGAYLSAGSTANLSFTGTPVVDVTYAGAVACSISWNATESLSIPLNIKAGTYALTINNSQVKNVDFTGFAGSLLISGTASIFGNLTLSSGMTVGPTTGTLIFAATSGTNTITSNGRTMDLSVTFNGVGGTWQLQDALTLGATRVTTLTSGTLDLNGNTLTTGTLSSSNSNIRVLTMTDASVVVLGNSWFMSISTNATVNASGSTVSMNSASSKTFNGGGLTFGILVQGGAGRLTIASSNTFEDISNTVQPATVRLTAGTTQTVGAFSLSGTSGNLITLDTTVAGTRATLSDASGTVSVSFVSIKDINATGGATWDALTANGNVDAGNNLGWNFGVVPVIVKTIFRQVFRPVFSEIFRPIF